MHAGLIALKKPIHADQNATPICDFLPKPNPTLKKTEGVGRLIFYSKFDHSFYSKICAKYHFFYCGLLYQYKFFKND